MQRRPVPVFNVLILAMDGVVGAGYLIRGNNLVGTVFLMTAFGVAMCMVLNRTSDDDG